MATPSLFSNWFGYLVERLARLHRYVSERSAEAPAGYGRGPHFASQILATAEELADELRQKAHKLPLLEAKEHYKNTFYSFARTAASRQQRLHMLIGYLPVPWPSPELELFLTRALEEADVLSHLSEDSPWTILLSGEVNFSHILLERHSSRILMPDLLAVPAAEKDNPLIWPNLVHEVAHDPALSGGIIRAAQGLELVTSQSPETKRTLEAWTHEIVADLLATDIIGPAYLGAFASFAAYWLPESLRSGSEVHPSPDSRIKYIYHRLRSQCRPLLEVLDAQMEEVGSRLHLDHDDDKNRHKLFDKLADGTNAGTLPERLVYDFVERIVELSEYRSIAPEPIGETDLMTVHELGEKLREGELIASHRRRLPSGKFENEEEVRESFAEAVDHLVEVPNDVRLILNAAFVRKMFHSSELNRLHPSTSDVIGYHQGLLRSFCEGDLPIRPRLERIAEQVSELDAIISKSIEAAEVMNFYQSASGGATR